MSVCTFLGKYILYLFNLICLISSVGILSIAFIIYQKFYKWSDIIGTEVITTPKILFAIGFGLFIIAIIGLCGVLRDSGCLLTLFTILLTIVLIGELLLSGVVYLEQDEIESIALDKMNQTVGTYNKTGHETTTHAWDLIQSDLECCGINNLDDWKPVLGDNNLPRSCCRAIPVNGSCTKDDSYQDGCYNILKTSIQENSSLLVWTAVGFALTQLFAVFLACCRKCSIRDEYETV